MRTWPWQRQRDGPGEPDSAAALHAVPEYGDVSRHNLPWWRSRRNTAKRSPTQPLWLRVVPASDGAAWF
ncbi:MAG: hypothetical protein PVSMB4_00180 [Ktedonobacterales bacterium]